MDKSLGFIEEDETKIWKKDMESIRGERKKLEHMKETDVVECKVLRERNCGNNVKNVVTKDNWTIGYNCGNDNCN